MKTKQPSYTIKDPDALFSRVVSEEFQPVTRETGWAVIINGLWVHKKGYNGDQKRLYASRNAAKERTEMEFKSRFRYQFYNDNNTAYDRMYKSRDLQRRLTEEGRDIAEDLDRSLTREFRKWMNSLYAQGRVQYVEVKKDGTI